MSDYNTSKDNIEINKQIVYCSDSAKLVAFITANDFSKLLDAIDYISPNTHIRPMNDNNKVYYNSYGISSESRLITFGFHEDGTLYIDIEMSYNSGVIHYEFAHEFWNSSQIKTIDTSIKATIPISNFQKFLESKAYLSESKCKGGMFVVQYIGGDLQIGDANGNNKFLIECKHGVYADRPDIIPLTDKDFTQDNLLCKIKFPYTSFCGPLMEFLPDYNAMDTIRLTIINSGTIYMESDNISERRIMDITKLESMYLASNVAYVRYREFPEIWNTSDDEISFTYMYSGFRHIIKRGEGVYIDPTVVTLYIRNDGIAMFKISIGDCVSYSTLYSSSIRNEIIEKMKNI